MWHNLKYPFIALFTYSYADTCHSLSTAVNLMIENNTINDYVANVYLTSGISMGIATTMSAGVLDWIYNKDEPKKLENKVGE